MKKYSRYEKACKQLKIKPLTLKDFNFLPEEDRVSFFAEHRIVVCIRVANTNPTTGKTWKPNWLNWDEGKWRPWWLGVKDEKKPSGVGFSFGGSGCGGTAATVGSRLVFKTEELSKYAGKQFLSTYKTWKCI